MKTRCLQFIVLLSIGMVTMSSCIKEAAVAGAQIIIFPQDTTGGGIQDPSLQEPWLNTDYANGKIELFITDPSMQLSLSSQTGGRLEVIISDIFFIHGGNSMVSTYNQSCIVNMSLIPKHVGKTTLHVYNTLHDTLIDVEILPEYRTYIEPVLDFDDTRDSIFRKLGRFCRSVIIEDAENGLYHILSPVDCRLKIFYTSEGTIDRYEVTLTEAVEEEELLSFIRERYYESDASYQGLPVYLRGMNVDYPSFSDASVAVIPNPSQSKVTYYNPMTFNE